MSAPAQNLDIVRRYLNTIEQGKLDAIKDLFTSDVRIVQLPNLIYPQGNRSDLKQMGEGFAKGRQLLSSQTYEIKTALALHDSVAIEVVWTGTLATSFGTLSAGSQMRAYSAMFFEFRDGKIASQRNYDCFERWQSP